MQVFPAELQNCERRAIAGPVVLCFLLCGGHAAGTTLPDGFVGQAIGSSGTWKGIVALDFAPDGRLFVLEKRGRVQIVKDGVKLPTPFLEIEKEVLDNGDRGLLGIALDPAFAANGFVYLLYTVDPNEDGVDDDGPSFSRLTRYTASSGDPDVADPASRKVLIGASWPEGIPSVNGTHAIGALRFAPDGSLLLSAGESARANLADAGGGNASAFGPERTRVAEDIGAFRAQWTSSLGGKVLRIDPATGGGLPSNPYFTGNAFDNASRVWAYGLRNPFRFCIRPGTGSLDPAAGKPGTLYIADVGWNTWEEISVSTRGGENFGWPCIEGPEEVAAYLSAAPAHHGCGTIGAGDNAGSLTPPVVSWHHADASSSHPPGLLGKCITGIAFYSGDSYPSAYRGACFVAEYDRDWIRAARLDPDNNLIEMLDFAADVGGLVDIVTDPVSGDLYYASHLRDEIRRVRFDPTNTPPSARAAAEPAMGPAPLIVAFSSAGSEDANGDRLAYHWTFGDGLESREANPVHLYERAGVYSAVLTVEDGRGGEASAPVEIQATGEQAGRHAPVPAILAPADNGTFHPDSVIELSGDADDEDPPELLQFTWQIVLHHNTHIHPDWLTLSGRHASFITRDHDDGTGIWLEIILQVTDSEGLTGTRKVSIHPAPQELVIDDLDARASGTGTWLVSDAYGPFGPRSLYSKVAGDTFTFDFTLAAGGLYRVFAWWTVSTTRTTAAPYTVRHRYGESTVLVDQTDPQAVELWRYIGTYRFDGTAKVTITAAGQGRSTCADAVCLLPLPGDPGSSAAPFHRGDADDTGALNLTDAVVILQFLFSGQASIPCLEAGDSDNSGAVDLTDAILLLNYLFLGGPSPAAPGPPGEGRTCDQDTDPPGSAGDLGCESYHCDGAP